MPNVNLILMARKLYTLQNYEFEAFILIAYSNDSQTPSFACYQILPYFQFSGYPEALYWLTT